MSPKPKEQLNEDEREAIREEGRAEGREEAMREAGETTPPISESSETIRRLARMETRPIVDKSITEHAENCPIAKIVDGIRVTIIRWGAVLGLIVVLLPIGIAWYSNREADTRATESLRKTIDAAADVARQLKAVQEAARGAHGSLEEPQPKKTEGLASAGHGATMPGRNW
jgi:hypothetical protein